MKMHRTLRSTLLYTVALLAACVFAPVSSSAASSKATLEPPAGPLPFIQDDYAKALALSRAQKAPLFVEFWAPW